MSSAQHITNKDIRQFFRSEVQSNVSDLFGYERLLEGPKGIPALLKEAMSVGAHFGRQQAKKEREIMAKQGLKRYLDQIYAAVHTLYLSTSKFLPSVNIVETRAKLCFATHEIQIMALVEYASFDDELKFGDLVSQLEFLILKKDNLIVDILYLQNDPGRVDYEAVKSDYPFMVKHAGQRKAQETSLT